MCGGGGIGGFDRVRGVLAVAAEIETREGMVEFEMYSNLRERRKILGYSLCVAIQVSIETLSMSF